MRGDGKACYNRMRLFYDQFLLFWFKIHVILSKRLRHPASLRGAHFFFIPTTGSVRDAHYTCGYFSVARCAGLKSAAPVFAKLGA